jgi:hypothetical protein
VRLIFVGDLAHRCGTRSGRSFAGEGGLCGDAHAVSQGNRKVIRQCRPIRHCERSEAISMPRAEIASSRGSWQ